MNNPKSNSDNNFNRRGKTNPNLVLAVCTCSLLCTCPVTKADPQLQRQQARLDERGPLKGGVIKVDKGSGEAAQTPRIPVRQTPPAADAATKPAAHAPRTASSPVSPPSLKGRTAESATRSTGSYDGDADHNVSQLDLAWEQWHKQISKMLWKRMSKLVSGTDYSGWARATITVTKDQQISFHITKAEGDPEVAENYEEAIASLDGNPNLEFPDGSQRRLVKFSLKCSQGHFSHATYDWNHGDVEKIREED